MRNVFIALHQSPSRSSPHDSASEIVSAVEEAGRFGHTAPTLILFAELFIGGYASGGDALRDSAIDLSSRKSGKNTQWLADIQHACQAHRVSVAFGCVELCGDAYYNSCVVVDENGDLRAVYRKCHLWGDYERAIFTRGDSLHRGIFELHGIVFGVLICFDVEFPEAVRALRRGGVEVLLVPTALVEPFNATVTVPSRAFENNFIVCYANEVGPVETSDAMLPRSLSYCGLSVIAFPDGTEGIRLSSGAQPRRELSGVVVDVESLAFQAALSRNNYFESLRPELY
jgi:predicted amidohydrolase